MSSPSLRRLSAAPLALAAALLLAAGCSTAPGASVPTGSSAPDSTSTVPTGAGSGDIEVAWLDGGRSIGIVTWGSSSADCRPAQGEAEADGQVITVSLSDRGGADAVCTADFAARAVVIAVPEGVDVTRDVELEITYGALREDADLDALAVSPEGPSDQRPSAGWFDDEGIVLLTWGSSSCPPIVEDVQATDAGATVSFATTDRVCTMDLAPRATVIEVPEPADDDAAYTLTLVGDRLDGEVVVIG